MPERDAADRRLAPLSQATWDLLVVGGGVVGSGVARDAAMRGLSVALVDAHDFAYGTSSRTSRLLHGGLRYLAQGRVGLVREASHEKKIVHRIAPHLAEPLAFVFPSYRGSRWPLWQLRIGVKAYDLLCGGKNLGASEALSREAVLQRIPGLGGDGLRGAVRYFDGMTNDARLVLDTLRSAQTYGAVLANYARATEVRRDGEHWRCRVSAPSSIAEVEVKARAVVHATGPWAETLTPGNVRIRPTKGVHLVIDRDRLPVPDAVVMADGSRILFAIPWQKRVILGTTDTDYQGEPEAVRTDADDVATVLGVANRTFPEVGLTEKDVISTWSGLRPLVANAKGDPSDISRAHEIKMSAPGWFDITGGKLTTYRLIAEQTLDRVTSFQGRTAAPCRTATEWLVPEAVSSRLSGIVPPEVSQEVVTHFMEDEWATHVEDVMIRRTSWHQYLHDADEVAERVAGWMAETAGWSSERQAEEIVRYRKAFG